MAQLNIHRVIESVPRPTLRHVHKFSSPVDSWMVRFFDPIDWRFGDEDWSLALLYDGNDVTDAHPGIRAMCTGARFRIPFKYQPWCATQPILALHPRGGSLHLYDVYSNKSRATKIAGFPLEIQWAPHGESIAVSLDGRVVIMDASGKDIFNLPIRHPDYEYPKVFWWPDGESFFIISRTSRRAKPKLSFYKASNGELLDKAYFDPYDFLPYDRDAYKMVRRARTCLRLRLEAAWGSGWMLDKWNRIKFDSKRRVLTAFVYRPVGPCEKSDGGSVMDAGDYMCDAEERGVEVKISS